MIIFTHTEEILINMCLKKLHNFYLYLQVFIIGVTITYLWGRLKSIESLVV